MCIVMHIFHCLETCYSKEKTVTKINKKQAIVM